MRRNSAARHQATIANMLLKYGRVDMYFVASLIGVSPSYAYQLLKMFMSNPFVHKELARRGVSVYWDGKEARLLKQETLEDSVIQEE